MARIKTSPPRPATRAAKKPKFSLVIPVRNGGDLLLQAVEAVLQQSTLPSQIIVYDTESTDGSVEKLTAAIGRKIPLRVIRVAKYAFDHGGTRNAALHEARYPWVLFMTQDAVPADHKAFAALFAAVTAKTAAVYGRQLAHRDAQPLAATARQLNYGDERLVQNMAAAPRLGIKTWFCSNSFCLWNRAALVGIGGFAEKLILGEDMHAAARLIQAGGTVIYEPRAQVRHSHNYTARDEFQRYFDIGVFHNMHAELLFKAGNANKEGLRFLTRQTALLFNGKSYFSLLKMPFHIAAKFLGYKLGRNYTLLGKRVARTVSMHKAYWS